MVFRSFEVQAYDYLVKLLVQKGYESTIVPFDDIVFCEIIDRKVYLHLRSGAF